jgi:hypothetical protein
VFQAILTFLPSMLECISHSLFCHKHTAMEASVEVSPNVNPSLPLWLIGRIRAAT